MTKKLSAAESALRDAAREYHALPSPGKITVRPTKPLSNQRDLSLAYSPGVAYPCLDIQADPAKAAEYTSRGNLVGVITNGTAVLGLGDIGPLAGKPVMEGKGCLFKKFAGIDVFDIELAERDPDKLVEIISALEPTLGGINLEDIKAPECFYIERQLREKMKIPVFHDDQHGTAIISGSALVNGLELVGKPIGEVKVAVSGAGAAALACLDIFVALGVNPKNIYVADSKGVIYKGRPGGFDESKARYAQDTDARTLADIVKDADVFLGCSAPGVLTRDMVKPMARQPAPRSRRPRRPDHRRCSVNEGGRPGPEGSHSGRAWPRARRRLVRRRLPPALHGLLLLQGRPADLRRPRLPQGVPADRAPVTEQLLRRLRASSCGAVHHELARCHGCDRRARSHRQLDDRIRDLPHALEG